MNERAESPERTASKHSAVWRIRHSRAVPAAAMLLFLALSVLWLRAAGTAQVYPQRVIFYRPPSPSHPYGVPFGVAGAVLTLGSVVLLLRRAIGLRLKAEHADRIPMLAVVVVGCVGVLAEIIVVHLVTQHAFSTAPFGYDDSGEQAAPIAALAIAQPLLVASLAGAWAVLAPTRPPDRRRNSRRIRLVSALLALGGMMASCTAFALWSLHATDLVVNAALIAGVSWVTNVGAWWPGLFAAMMALTMVVAVCTPAFFWSVEGCELSAAPAATESDTEAAGVNPP
jgi:hypothetical protein